MSDVFFIHFRFLVNSGAFLNVNTSQRLHASVCNAGCYQLLCRNNIENYGTLIMSRVFLQ